MDGVFRKSDVYKKAVIYIKKNEDINKKAGSIERFGYWGSAFDAIYQEEGPDKAGILLPVIGEKGRVKVKIHLVKENGKDWEVVNFVILE